MVIKNWFSTFEIGVACLLACGLWLAGCTNGLEPVGYPVPDTQKITSPIPSNTLAPNPGSTLSEAADGEPSRMVTVPPDKNLPVQPAKDLTPSPADQLALTTLAIRLGVPSGEIKILSRSPWTNDAPTCNLAMNEKQKVLLSGDHMQVILSYKDRSYEYWVFQSGDVQFAMPCQ